MYSLYIDASVVLCRYVLKRRSVIICEIIVHLLVIVQKKKTFICVRRILCNGLL
jgi:hypothetical protein